MRICIGMHTMTQHSSTFMIAPISNMYVFVMYTYGYYTDAYSSMVTVPLSLLAHRYTARENE